MFSCCRLHQDYKFVHLHRGVQICTPSQRCTNLYTFTEGVQISQRCTNLYTFTEGVQISQRCTNLYTFTEGVQICTPSQRFTNLYTFTEVYWCMFLDSHTLIHWQVYTGSLIVPEYHCNYRRHLKRLTELKILDKDIEMAWMEATFTATWKHRKIGDPQNRHRDRSWSKIYKYYFELDIYHCKPPLKDSNTAPNKECTKLKHD